VFECCDSRKIPYHAEYPDFKVGKLYLHDRLALGVTLYAKPVSEIGEVTQPVRRWADNRPDGPLTHW
jgi:hypothetical protein